MRFNQDRATIERTGERLIALLDEGKREVSIERVLGWLGYQAKPPAQPAGPAPDSGVDPLTGCAPVTAREPGDQAVG